MANTTLTFATAACLALMTPACLAIEVTPLQPIVSEFHSKLEIPLEFSSITAFSGEWLSHSLPITKTHSQEKEPMTMHFMVLIALGLISMAALRKRSAP